MERIFHFLQHFHTGLLQPVAVFAEPNANAHRVDTIAHRGASIEEVLDEFRGKTGILIELKSPELYPGVEEQVAAALSERNMDKPENEKIIVQSFNFDSMKKFHELLPDVPVGVLTSNKNDLTDENWRNSLLTRTM